MGDTRERAQVKQQGATKVPCQDHTKQHDNVWRGVTSREKTTNAKQTCYVTVGVKITLSIAT